jgi:tetratricopeptide (TPR) repeat protein
MNGRRLVEFARATLIAAALALPTAQPAARVLEPRATLTTATGSLEAALEIDGKSRGYLRITDASGSVVQRTKLVTHRQVLPLLIDRRLSPLWPALLDWAGPSLERLRARMLADSEAAFARGKKAYGEEIAPFLTGKAGAIGERAVLLFVTGSPDRAIAMLQDATAGWDRARSWDKDEQGLLLNMLGSLLSQRGRTEEADRVFASAPEQLGPGSHLLNTMATHGFLLAEAGLYQQALDVVDATAAQYKAKAKTINGMLRTIPGSERYFAATRGCALSGLGRLGEAEAALKPVLATGEPRSLLWKVEESNSEIRIRTFLCLKDADRLAQEIVKSVAAAPVAPAAVMFLQPRYSRPGVDTTVWASVRADPRMVAALTPIARPLPPELVPALNDWAD